VIQAEAERALADAVGEGGLESHAPVPLDGSELAWTARPADPEALARLVAALRAHRLAAVVRGSGSGLGLGNPPQGAQLFLSLDRLAGVDELDEVEGVCHVAAGTPLSALREKLAPTAWELPLDAPEASATVGGCLAAARTGPRSLGHGLPRDVLLGLEVVLGSGERTRCGGRVVKNVTGYDLAKLYTGSLGSLGVIEGAWLRLVPKPARVAALALEAPSLEDACAAGLFAARLASARAVVATASGGAARVAVELAGDGPAVEGDAAQLARAYGAEPADAGETEAAARRAVALPEAELRFRVSARASRLPAAARTLCEAGAALAIEPGLGLVHAGFAPGRAEAAAAWQAARAAAREGGGAARLESAPLAVKRAGDVFAAEPAVVALSRALKERFDPERVLNPGRFVGGL
jgi:glycolate oxidase FAD binding subunit